jgi:uncharacterized protein YjiS (DUF1127 family)
MMIRPQLLSSVTPAAAGLTPVELRRAVLASSIGRWIARIRSERRIRRGSDELMACDDRMLADVGVRRADIGYVARYGRLPRHGPDGVRR